MTSEKVSQRPEDPSSGKVLDLGMIKIDSQMPEQLHDIFKKSSELNFNSYSAPAGIPGVRKLVSSALIGTDDYSSVVMTAGASGAFLSFLLASIKSQTSPRITLPDPCYPGFLGLCKRFGIGIDLFELNAGRINLDSLKSAINRDTMGVVLISPGNPDGKLIDSSDLSNAEQIAANYSIPVVLDQSYADLLSTQDTHQKLAFLEERSIQIRSFSKSFALSGFRCGALITTPNFAHSYAQAHYSALLSAPTIGQLLAARCMNPDISGRFLEKTRNRLLQRQEMLVTKLGSIPGVAVQPNDIGLFAWIALNCDGNLLARNLRELGIVVVPGLAFGPRNSRFIRVLSDIPEEEQNRFVAATGYAVRELGLNE